MKIYQSNTYEKDFSWLDLNKGQRVQERQCVKEQEFYITVSVLSNISKQFRVPAQPQQ